MASRYLAIVYLICIVLPAKSVFAQTFCVDSEIEIHNALNAAASNSESDLIKIVQGTYLGNFSFSGTDKFHDITIEGGYTKYLGLCVSPTPPAPPSETVLDGEGYGRVINIEKLSGDVAVRRLMIQNGNSMSDGGGIRVALSSSRLTTGSIEFAHNIFDGNHADGFGGGVYASSRSLDADTDMIHFTDNIARNNSSAHSGGGIYISSNADSGQSGAIEFSKNTITNNEASRSGGGMSVTSTGTIGSGPILITHNHISGNTVPEDPGVYWPGGGLSISSITTTTNFGNVDIINNLITENQADGSGGGIFAWFNSVDDSGIITFTHNTISGNQAGYHGGGLYLNTSLVTQTHNNIVWGNSSPDESDDIYLVSGITVNAHAHYNDFAHVLGSWLSESNNVNVNPAFVGGGDYHLQASSPCMDKGTDGVSLPANDIDGDNRVIGIAPDLGADEFAQPQHNCVPYTPNGKMLMICW